MAAKASVKVRERKLADGRIRLCYDLYKEGDRELRTDEHTLYVLPTDSAEVKAAKRKKAAVTAQELLLALMKGEYVFRNPKRNTSLELGSIGIDTYPTFLSLFEAEAARRSEELAVKHAYKIKLGRQVHKKSYDDVHYSLQLFKAFLLTKGKTDLHYQDLTPTLLKQFRGYLMAKVYDDNTKFCQNTAAAYMKKLKTVAFIAHNEGLLTMKVVASVPTIQLQKPKRMYLTKQEVTRLLCDLRKNPTDSLFKRAFLFSCMVSLRFGDLVTIKWGDVREGRLIFRPGKNQERTELNLGLNSTALELLGERQSDDQVIFPIKYSSALNDKLQIWSLTNGINRDRITWHSGRHTCATMLLSKTGNLALVQGVLGHSRVATTSIYAHLLNPDVDKALDSITIEIPEAEF